MIPTVEMQKIVSMWCSCSHGAMRRCKEGDECRASMGRPNCPFLAELLAAMPKVDDLAEARGQSRGMRDGQAHSLEFCQALEARVAALTKRVEALEAESEERERTILHGGMPA